MEADSSVYPCDFYMLDQYRLGNLNQDGYPALDRKRAEIGFVEQSVALPEECKTCPYVFLCRNGCRRCRDAQGKNIFCESYQRFFAYAQGRMKSVAQACRNASTIGNR